MLTPAADPPTLDARADATASRLLSHGSTEARKHGSTEARKHGSTEADVNYTKDLSSSLFKVVYVIRTPLYPASYGLYP